MDQTLRDYLSHADDIHEYILKFSVCLKPEQLESKLVELQASIKTIQSISKRIADIANLVNHELLYRKQNSSKHINPYPTSNDHVVMRYTDPPDMDKKTVVGDIVLPIKTVETEIQIPVSHVYYISSLKQYAINIAGVIVKGNLGNIVEYQTNHSSNCEYGIKCKSFNKDQPCNYYHPPEDYLKLGKEIPDIKRNFTVGSWLYSRNYNPRAYFVRHIGSADTIIHDLEKIKKIQYREEIITREGQLMHDVLAYMILHNHGLLEKYQHWDVK